MKRRDFLTNALVAGTGLWATGQLQAAPPTVARKRQFIVKKKGDARMPFQQPPLPFAMDALKPFLSEEQMMYHYTKHHAAYFKNLNGLVEGKPEAELSLRDLVIQATGPVFNNAGQAWNHTFFWECMKPNGGGEPQGELADAIRRDFGSFDAFRKSMSETAVKVFGSGWGWLAADKQGKLEIMGLSNADTPLKHGKEPVLTVDVWEHAYYVDYRNERAKFVDGFWNVVNWDHAAKCYAKARAS